jgi:hypothetical protein
MSRWFGSRTRKATGKSLSDAVLFYFLLRSHLFYFHGACGTNDFTLIALWVGFPFSKNLNSGHLVGRVYVT